MALPPGPVPLIDERALFSAQPAWADVLWGLRLPVTAARLILRSGRLRALSAVCAGVTFGALVALGFALFHVTPDLVSLLFAKPPSWYGQAAWYAAVTLAFLGLFALGATTVPLLLLAPLQDPLSEATEVACGGPPSGSAGLGGMVGGTLRSLAHTVARLALLWGGQLVLLPLHLLPGAGSLVWTALAGGWTILWIAAEYLDIALARHGYRFRELRAALKRRFALCIGFGAAVYLLLWVPVLNFFFLPLAVVGGTLLFRGLLASGAIQARPNP